MSTEIVHACDVCKRRVFSDVFQIEWHAVVWPDGTVEHFVLPGSVRGEGNTRLIDLCADCTAAANEAMTKALRARKPR